MNGFRIPILMTLSLLMLTLPLAAQSVIPSPTDSANEYGIDPGRLYPGTMVLELIAAIEDEAVIAIDDSYAAGYKAGLLSAAPDLAFWKSQAEYWQEESEQRFKLEDTRSFAPILTALTAGFGLGALLALLGR